MDTPFPQRIPTCAIAMLARPEWFADPEVVRRAQVGPAKGLAGILSSRFFARQEIAAITLGRKIHFRQRDQFNPHSAGGLALLAHELKHVEQYEREGFFKFYAKYFWAYVVHGYGESVPFENEAYDFGRHLDVHLRLEIGSNADCHFCVEQAEPHTPNDQFVKQVPKAFGKNSNQ